EQKRNYDEWVTNFKREHQGKSPPDWRVITARMESPEGKRLEKAINDAYAMQKDWRYNRKIFYGGSSGEDESKMMIKKPYVEGVDNYFSLDYPEISVADMKQF